MPLCGQTFAATRDGEMMKSCELLSLIAGIGGFCRHKIQSRLQTFCELTFHNITVPLKVEIGQQLRVWYIEDLRNEYERDNTGKACVDVYALKYV